MTQSDPQRVRHRCAHGTARSDAGLTRNFRPDSALEQPAMFFVADRLRWQGNKKARHQAGFPWLGTV
ncbi:hypothetical protein SynBMKMC1_01852 [Synechococcus sp. BMK-MC-1]|nr:hypothetical protein SynBMKMC1_01852 [Synechococcus sp. BMK-MC-1]